MKVTNRCTWLFKVWLRKEEGNIPLLRPVLFFFSLCQQASQGRASFVQIMATPGQQTASIHGRLLSFISPHGAIPLFDPPADGTFGGVVRPIHPLAMGPLPLPIPGQLRPQIPAVQHQQPYPISQTVLLSFARRFGLPITLHHSLQFRLLVTSLPMAATRTFFDQPIAPHTPNLLPHGLHGVVYQRLAQ